MTLKEIKAAIAEDKRVYWSTDLYEVILDHIGQYLIVCKSNGNTIGLTWMDGITMNGEEKDFFIKERTVGSVMSNFNVANYTISNLKKVLTLFRENLKVSEKYLKNIRDFANKEHITVSENKVKEQIKECNLLENHISKLEERCSMTPEKMQVIINIRNMSKFLEKGISFDVLETKSIMTLRLFQDDLIEEYNEKMKR